MTSPADYRDVAARVTRDNVLFAVMVELTYRCNLDCVYCYNDLAVKGMALPLERYRTLIDELAEMQVMHLVLTGGEPLAHPGFFAIGSHARERGFVVRVKSNGHALGEPLARRLRDEVDPFVVDVSVHGASAETHDRQTRVEGSFERLTANLETMRRLGLRVKLSCTLTRWNENEIEGMVAIADRLGFALGINTTVSPRDDGDRSPLALQATREGRLRALRLLHRRAAAAGAGEVAVTLAGRESDEIPTPTDPGKNCGAGSSTVTIDPYGNVLPCVQWRRPVGNLHRQTMREIWEGSASLDDARRITTAARGLVDARPGGHLMDFCPGIAQLETGDPLTLYPSAIEQQELLEAFRESAPKSVRRLPIVY